MEEILRQTLLFDFYGELLTSRQREVFEEVVCNDTSYSEMAAGLGVSRQSVHDLVRRTQAQLDAYENKLHLVERFLLIREDVRVLREEIAGMKDYLPEERFSGILRIADDILEKL